MVRTLRSRNRKRIALEHRGHRLRVRLRNAVVRREVEIVFALERGYFRSGIWARFDELQDSREVAENRRVLPIGLLLVELHLLCEVQSLQNLETAFVGTARSKDRPSRKSRGDGLRPCGLVSSHVARRDLAAVVLNGGDEQLSPGSGVHRLRAVLGDAAECLCQIDLNEAIASLRHFVAGLMQESPTLRSSRQELALRGEVEGEEWRYLHTVFGVPDRRLEQILKGKFAEAFVHGLNSGHEAGYQSLAALRIRVIRRQLPGEPESGSGNAFGVALGSVRIPSGTERVDLVCLCVVIEELENTCVGDVGAEFRCDLRESDGGCGVGGGPAFFQCLHARIHGNGRTGVADDCGASLDRAGPRWKGTHLQSFHARPVGGIPGLGRKIRRGRDLRAEESEHEN